jgi:hypothetical protein
VKPANIAITTFILGTVVGFLAIAGGYIAYAISTDYFDREGATGMAVVFMEAPLGGVIIGIVSAVVIYKILKRRAP